MAENSCVDIPINSTTKYLPNPEAHTALQLLIRRSSDDEEEDDGLEDEEEEEDTEEEIEEEDENEQEESEEGAEIKDETSDYEPSASSENTQISHSSSSSSSSSSIKLNSSISFPFAPSWGRGSRSPTMSPSGPTSAPPLIHSSAPSFNSYKSNTLSCQQHNGSDPHLTTITTNGYHTQGFSSKRRFNEQIDFSFNASTTKIVFVDDSGYRKALRMFDLNRIYHEPTRNYADIWSFCLNSRRIRFYDFSEFRSQVLNSSKEITTPQTRISPCDLLIADSPFWLVFDRRPIFNEPDFNIDNESIKEPSTSVTNMTILGRIRFFQSVHVRLSYGALTSMNEYYYHPIYNFLKRSEWTIQFRPKKLEIERLDRKTMGESNNWIKEFRKSILPADLIDRAAIFTVNRYGFTVYICTKGNLHEYKHIVNYGEKRLPIERLSSENDDCPIFSTICLHVAVKKRSNNYHDKYSALDQIKSLFRYLIDFFYSNQISVCFASIKSEPGCLTNIPALSKNFLTPIQIYAFTMLRNVGYSIEQKINQNKTIRDELIKLSKNDDDKFYRLCLYLYRRATEYHFLNLESELREADREYKYQLEQCQALNEKMATLLSPPRTNYAYVPSIRVTPTTIQVQPLKLVKHHRVLRERNFDDPMSFALVEIRDEANRPLYARDFCSLRKKFKHILTHGILIHRTRYLYLHHSMSQVKEKQFWFLDSKYSIENVLSWLGNFDNERVIAKHAARIALCFTSTEPSIPIPAEHVKYIPDIETPDKQYCFTDGVGTISPEYCKKVQKKLGRRFMPSVLQIRYGGCKGTVSVDPRLDNQEHQLIIRHSMLKFKTEHNELEICKISSPRALYLNRQDILLLSSRGIPEAHFLVLQNENHLWLVQALLCSSVGFELLTDRVGSNYFRFRDIANAFNLVEEPFFLQLLITCGHDCVSKFQQRAKIKTAKNKARNMFGIVDEYGVLEYGQVFIQYSHMNDEKLDVNDKPTNIPPTILDNVKVVITKNPCHHPGDLRTFKAVDRVELRHLVDVVVFPQKGPRPHPNEISGSDLDGDEYAVIWDEDFVPTTENDDPYNYDCQEKPIKLDRPVERNDIIEVVLDIAAQNLTGDMSNLHLATADKLDTRDKDVLYLAGLISQELDAPKTGKHPIRSEDLHRYRVHLLEERYPDFMMRERYKSYPSTKIIGQLFRSARRAIIRWHKAARTHCSLRSLHNAQLEDEALNDENFDSTHHHIKPRHSIDYTNNRHEPSLILDPTIQHPLSKEHEKWARNFFSAYRENLRNIISVFNYQDEIDLFCRCEALDQLASGKQDLNISAGLELQRLIDTTCRYFYHDFDQLVNDQTAKSLHKGECKRDRTCEDCKEIKLARAVACYYVCYSQAAKQSTKARSRILSFPWLFGSLLTKVKQKNQNLNTNSSLSKYIVIGRALRNYAKQLIEKSELKLKVYCSPYSDQGVLHIRSIKSTLDNNCQLFKRKIFANDQQTNEICLRKILFIEIINHWINKQNIFGEHIIPTDKKPLVREICWHQLLIDFISKTNEENSKLVTHFEEYKVVFQTTNHLLMTQRYTEYIKREISMLSIDFDTLMYDYFIHLIRLCFQLARDYKSNEYAYLSEYLILALQAIGIEKDLNDISIDADT